MGEEKKIIALTFDDGPTPGITDAVLDVLEENDIVASFFLIGEQVTKETQYLVKRAYDMGCTIENHSWTHPFMTKISEKEIEEEIQKTTDIIVDTIGEAPQYFRPPYIDYDKRMYELIDLNFISGYGCEDWEDSVSTETRVARVLSDAKDGNIVLLHDMKNNEKTVEAIKEIIPALKDRGYEFVTIRELFKRRSVVPQRNCNYDGVFDIRKNYE